MSFKALIKWLCTDTILEPVWKIGKNIKNKAEQRKKQKFEEFRRYLDMENPAHKCFLCGEYIQEKPGLHYVLPYFLVYSDNLFNLAYAHQQCIIEANECLPTPEQIIRLEERNERLLHIMHQKGIHNDHTEELEYCIGQQLIRRIRNQSKFYSPV